MYNIYVTNKSKKNVYVRLQSQKISTLNESFHHELERFRRRDNPSVDAQQSINSYLVRWGFCIIPAQVTVPFATEGHNDEPRMYASLYAHSKLWVMDYEVNYARYGCVFVENKNIKQPGDARCGLDTRERSARPPKEEELYLSKANPNPVWIPRQTKDLVQNRLRWNTLPWKGWRKHSVCSKHRE